MKEGDMRKLLMCVVLVLALTIPCKASDSMFETPEDVIFQIPKEWGEMNQESWDLYTRIMPIIPGDIVMRIPSNPKLFSLIAFCSKAI